MPVKEMLDFQDPDARFVLAVRSALIVTLITINVTVLAVVLSHGDGRSTPSTPTTTTRTATAAFSNLASAAEYGSSTKTAYEKGFGRNLGIVDADTNNFLPGNSVASKASRRTAVVTLVATIAPAQQAAASVATVTASTLQSNIAAAAAGIAGVNIPTVVQIVMAAAATTIEGQGQVLGKQEIPGINVFYGIPYAKAPAGDLRWQPPVAPDPWSEPLEGFSYGPACPQGGFPGSAIFPTQSEDCLHINVATPEGAQGLPVMFWIHGGANTEEAAYEPFFNLSTLVQTSGMRVVVVSIDYRLGVFGFLGSSELAASLTTGQYAGSTGNYGLMDQRFAMEWVNKHIAAFGGDPNQVTLFGESAGAYDIGFHLVQPGSYPYYKRAIMQSYGDSQIEHISMAFAQDVYNRILSSLSCSDLACLRSKTAAELVAAAEAVGTPLQTAGKWNPVIDGVYTTGTGWDLMLQGQFNDKAQVLLGADHDENSILTGFLDIMQGKLPADATEADFDSFLDSIQVSPRLTATQKAHVKSLYAWGTYDDYPSYLGAAPSYQGLLAAQGKGGPLSKWWWAGTMAVEDAASPHSTGYCTHRRMAKHLTQKIDTYIYIWAHPPQYIELNQTLPGKIMFGPDNSMVPHSSELRYVFNAMNGQYCENITSMDRAVALATASSWAAFAVTGDPSSSTFTQAFKGWEKYSNTEDKTYYIAPSRDSFEGGSMRKVRAEQCDYWETLTTITYGPGWTKA